jgi:hypothetical protein
MNVFKSIKLWCQNRFLRKGFLLISIGPETVRNLSSIKQLNKKHPSGQTLHQAHNLRTALLSTQKTAGDIAEVGVWQGASAAVICDTKPAKAVHLFDTFSGIPHVDPKDDGCYQVGDYIGSLDSVQRRLADYPDLHFYQGLFPDTAAPVKNHRFSFVHLDVDVYESTRAALTFFYPRMNVGGIILSHDYPDAPGVKSAFDEFFQDRAEPVIPLLDSQCLIVKAAEPPEQSIP